MKIPDLDGLMLTTLQYRGGERILTFINGAINAGDNPLFLFPNPMCIMIRMKTKRHLDNY